MVTSDLTPILFLDVDGVLNAMNRVAMREQWPDAHRTTAYTEGYHFDITYSKRMGKHIESWPFEIRWLTTWADDANHAIAPLFNWGTKHVSGRPDHRDERQWKLQRIKAEIAWEQRPFVWIDDVATNTPQARAWSAEVSKTGLPHLLQTPNPARGIDRPMVDRIERWLTVLKTPCPPSWEEAEINR